MTKQSIAAAYGISRQWVYELCENHGFTFDDFREPERIFEQLLLEGNSSQLRERLADFNFRESIRKTLNQ